MWNEELKPPSVGAWLVMTMLVISLLSEALHTESELILGVFGLIALGWAFTEIGGWLQRCHKAGVWRRQA